MNRQALIVIGFVAAAGFAGAYALGLLSPSAPPERENPAATAPAPAPPQPRDTSAPALTPTPDRPRTAERTPPPAPIAPPAAPVAAPTTATLRIDSDVPGAQVFVDNKFVGAAPATASDIQPGQRKINVQAPGYEGVIEYVNVDPGPRDITISLKTIRLDQKIAVTHKHRVGSCSGTLVATPDGIRYVTDHREDGFTVSLLNIETFKADFLQKNLEIKIRGGRTYDFTDPSGKADALYLFHQEVDKVRQRMLKERD